MGLPTSVLDASSSFSTKGRSSVPTRASPPQRVSPPELLNPGHERSQPWILDFGFWILDLGFWMLGFWILDFGLWILDFSGGYILGKGTARFFSGATF